MISICRDCSPHCVLLGVHNPEGYETVPPDRCPHSTGGTIEWSHELHLDEWIAICEQAPTAAMVEALKGREGVTAYDTPFDAFKRISLAPGGAVLVVPKEAP